MRADPGKALLVEPGIGRAEEEEGEEEEEEEEEEEVEEVEDRRGFRRTVAGGSMEKVGG